MRSIRFTEADAALLSRSDEVRAGFKVLDGLGIRV